METKKQMMIFIEATIIIVMGNFSCPTSSYARVFVWEEGSIFFSNPLLCGFDDHLRVVFHFLTLGWDGEPRGWCTNIRGLKQRL